VSTTGLSLSRGRGRARRWTNAAALVLAVLATALLAGVLAGKALGYQPLVDRSDSMQPAIAAGDVVIVRAIAPAEASEGDIVTFKDPERNDELLTHRVVSVRSRGDTFAFVTRGDANTGVERWTIPAAGTLGRFVARVPRLGYAIAWLGIPAVRLAFISVAALLLGAAALRRIWSG
jgi:signal peptidase